jgi:hypothetical protein
MDLIRKVDALGRTAGKASRTAPARLSNHDQDPARPLTVREVEIAANKPSRRMVAPQPIRPRLDQVADTFRASSMK